MNEHYIITFEDGSHYETNKLSEEDKEANSDGFLTIIRWSDLKILNREGDWKELPKWE